MRWNYQMLCLLLLFVASATAQQQSMNICPAGQTGGSVISVTSNTTCARFMALKLPSSSFSTVANTLRENLVYTPLPTYDRLGGPTGNGHITFTRTPLVFINGGPQTLNVKTNGGFTIVAMVRFVDPIGSFENIFGLSVLVGTTETSFLWIYRYLTEKYLSFQFYYRPSNTIVQLINTAATFNQNTWVKIVVRYRTTTRLFEFIVNDVLVQSTGSPTDTIFDYQIVRAIIGSNPLGSSGFNGNIAGLFIVDEYLTTESIAYIVTQMNDGVDFTNTTCPFGNNCTACAAGTYKSVTGASKCKECMTGTYSTTLQATVATTCIACTNNMYSSTGSNSSNNCCTANCNEGFTGPTIGLCTSCAAGKYKDVKCPDNGCTNCPAGKYSAITGATICSACDIRATSATVSTALTACICKEGYTGPDGGTCTMCPAGKYKTVKGSIACTNCGVAKYSTTRAATTATTCLGCPPNSGIWCSACQSLTSCECNPGSIGTSGGTCTLCPVGKWRYNQHLCLGCGPGTYSATTGATAAATCLACPTNTGDNCIDCSLVTNCSCNKGYTGPSGGTCNTCATGTYKDATSSGTCTACPANSGSDANSGASITSSCPCNAGYVGGNLFSSFSLTACSRFVALITWKPSFASVSTRVNSSIGTMPTYVAQGGPNANGHVSFDRSRSQWLITEPRTFNCQTNGGMTILLVMRYTGTILSNETPLQFWTGGTKVEFTLQRSSSSNSIALNIYNGGSAIGALSHSSDLTTSWNYIRCQWLSSTNELSIRVNSGTISKVVLVNTWPDKQLQGIYLGRDFSATRFINGDIAGAFVVDEYLSDAATTAIYNSMLNGVDLTNTICPSGTACTACVAGTYKTTAGSSPCLNCSAGQTSPTASTSNASCIVSVSHCNAGYTGPSGGDCAPCAHGTYKNATGSVACTPCAAGTYSPTAAATSAATCLACPTGSTSSIASSSCIMVPCDPGYTGPDGICSTCAAGTYKPTTGSAACTHCAAGSYSTTAAATTATTCIACPAYSTSPSMSTASTACTCNAGYSGANGEVCTACAAGSFKTVSGSAVCTNCAAGTYSTTVAGTVATTCLACPVNSNSPSRSSALAVCACNAGFTGLDGGACTPCSAGTFKTNIGSAACTDCAAGTYSSTAVATSDAECLACPIGSTSPTASTALAACICQKGFTGPNEGPCTVCLDGQYKSTTGSGACIACVAGTYSTASAATTPADCVVCPGNSTSPLKSTAATACTCNAGYTGANGGPCSACAAGSYKTATGSAACTSCPAVSGANCASCATSNWCACTGYTGDTCTACVSSSVPASTSLDNCVCGPGRYDASAA